MEQWRPIFSPSSPGPKSVLKKILFLGGQPVGQPGSQPRKPRKPRGGVVCFLFFDRLGLETQILPEGSDGGQVIWDSIH